MLAIVLGLVGCGESKKDKEMREMEEQVARSMTKEIREGKVWDYRSYKDGGLKRQTWVLISSDATYKSPYARLVINKISNGLKTVTILAEHTKFKCRDRYCPFIAEFDNTEQIFTFDASTSRPDSQVALTLLDSEVDSFIAELKKAKTLTVSGGFFMVEMPSARFDVGGLDKLKATP